jgi:hypothetical protein
LLIPRIATAQVAISVHLAGGRDFTAALDAQTDADRLWLRFENGGAELLRPVDWDRVVTADLAGHRLSGVELRRMVAEVRRELPATPAGNAGGTVRVPATRTRSVRTTLPAAAQIVMIGPPLVVPASAGNANGAEQPPKGGTTSTSGRTPRVVSLAIDARAGRWDENVEPDGLVVRVYPLDADGAVVPVRGTLTVDLWAEATPERSGWDWRREPFQNAGHWTEAVRAADFGPGGATYRLRFYPSFHPEFEHWMGWRGAVHACLAVPGQGTFEATDDMAIIRPWSTVREHLQQVTRHGYFPGYRYFPDERTDDGRR